ncbi:MAG: TonB-dependent receptor [Pseudoxanthomonas sp.]
MPNTKKLSSAIHLALFIGVTSFTAGNALAQDGTTSSTSSSDEKSDKTAHTLDSVAVTGSRIKRADIEGALPITVITREDLDISGQTSVGEYLQTNTLNSFGSTVPSSGSSAQSFSGISLHGMGEGRTLVLIDGHRAPTSPQTGEGQDLNVIPMAMVERIEILTDGASAIYGADAMGGVVNIITRKDFNGGEVTLGNTNAEWGGGTGDQSAVFGFSSDRGHMVVGVSHNKRDITYDRDMPWETSKGVSSYANNFYSVDYDASGDPVTGSFLEAVPGGCTGTNFYTSGSHCYYDYTKTMAITASEDQRSIFMNGEYYINDAWTAYASLSATHVKSYGVYAPATSDDGIYVSSSSSNNPTGEDVMLYTRFVGLGNRINIDTTDNYNVVLGTRWQANDRLTFDFGISLNDSYFTNDGYNYVNLKIAQELIEDGTYDVANPYANSSSVLDQIRATVSRNGFYKEHQAYVNGNLDLFGLGGGTSQLAFGAEYTTEDYEDIYDAQSAAGNIGGSAGNSAWGSRSVGSAYAEWNLPFTSSFEADLAARFDHYSDFGNATSPKLSLRWQPLDSLTLRSSIGEGFRAPTLVALNQQPASSADSVVDAATAEALGVSSTSSIQISAVHVASPDLQPEKSTQFSFGAVWDATSWLSTSLDYYNNVIRNQIKWFSAQEVVNRTNEGTYLPSNLYVVRNSSGAITTVYAGYGNEGKVNTDGVDFKVNTRFDFGAYGKLSNQLQFDWVHSYKIEGDEEIGHYGYPEWRAKLVNTYELGRWSFSWTVNAIAHSPEYYEDYLAEYGYSCQEALEWGYVHTCKNKPYITHDVQLTYNAPWKGKISLGAINLTGRQPVLDYAYAGSGGYNTYLYNPYGRQLYLRYSQDF